MGMQVLLVMKLIPFVYVRVAISVVLSSIVLRVKTQL